MSELYVLAFWGVHQKKASPPVISEKQCGTIQDTFQLLQPFCVFLSIRWMNVFSEPKSLQQNLDQNPKQTVKQKLLRLWFF